MPPTLSRRHLLFLAAAVCARPALAAPRRYALVTETSQVSFSFTLNGTPQTGTVPVADADIRVDPTNLASSSAAVSADIRGVRTGFLFITEALLSPAVLDAQNHPVVSFRSTRVRLGAGGRISDGATIEGDLTLRGVTRTIALNAVLSRPTGSRPDDLSTLFIDLDGRLDRRDFGASGYPQMVAPEVILDIRAEIRAMA